MNKKRFTTKEVIMIALFAGLTVILSQISIPLPFTPIPMNLATVAVFMAGGLLESAKGATSQIVYVLLGLVGLPVFAGLQGGIGRVVGPTGGYIVGYIVAAIVIGVLMHWLPRTVWGYCTAMTIGITCCYILGTVWFMILTRTGFAVALSMCVIPFLVGDVLKIIVAAVLVKRLRKLIVM